MQKSIGTDRSYTRALQKNVDSLLTRIEGVKLWAGLAVTLVIVVPFATFYLVKERPKPQTSYYGILFSDTKADVEYKLGYPSRVDDGDSGYWALAINVKDLDQKVKFETYNGWEYDVPSKPDVTLDISFLETGQVDSIACYSDDNSPGSCSAVLGININDTEDNVAATLGKPTSSYLEYDTKTLFYQRLNLIVFLDKQHVYGLKICTHFDHD
jgi:hypothetical protein